MDVRTSVIKSKIVLIGNWTALLAWLATLLALKPQEWLDNLGAWAILLFWGLGVAFVFGCGVLVGARLLRPRSGAASVPGDAVVEMAGRLIDGVRSGSGRDNHVVRLLLVTGRHINNHLLEIVSRCMAHGDRWDVRVLILDPGSGDVSLLRGDSRDHIQATLNDLATVQSAATANEWPVKIRAKTYDGLSQPLRGLLVDEVHLLVDCTVWEGGVDGSPWLDTTRKTMTHVTAESSAGVGGLRIDVFRSWFDHLWRSEGAGSSG